MTEIACKWMNSVNGRHVWRDWTPTSANAKTVLYIGGIFPMNGTYPAPGISVGMTFAYSYGDDLRRTSANLALRKRKLPLSFTFVFRLSELRHSSKKFFIPEILALKWKLEISSCQSFTNLRIAHKLMNRTCEVFYASQTKILIVKTRVAAQPILRHYYHASFPSINTGLHAFSFFGLTFGILIDQNLKPFLVEETDINTSHFHGNSI